METNLVDFSEAGRDIGNSMGATVVNMLDGFSETWSADQVPDIMGTLGAILVSILVIGGLYWVVRRLIKSYRSTR